MEGNTGQPPADLAEDITTDGHGCCNGRCRIDNGADCSLLRRCNYDCNCGKDCHPLAIVLAQCISRTTVEGLPNLVRAVNLWRKLSWLLILLFIVAVGSIHLAFLIINFQNSSIYSTMTIEANSATFPDVTICSLKPVSESLLLGIGSSKLRDNIGILQNEFDRVTRELYDIDRWISEEERRKRSDESMSDYKARMEYLFKRLLAIENIRRHGAWSWLGMDFNYSFLFCKFDGVSCQEANFTRSSSYDNVNCLTFSPNSELLLNPSMGSESGLHLKIFTDSNFFESGTRKYTTFSESKWNYSRRGLRLSWRLWDDEEFRLNNLLSKQDSPPEGVQVILHPRGTYPFNDHQSFIVSTGTRSSFQIYTVEQNKLNHKGSCSTKPMGSVSYNITHNSHSNETRRRQYLRVPEDSIHEFVQKEVFKHCRCYSHRVPTEVEESKLCYFLPNSEAKPPHNLSNEVADRIACHDQWQPQAEVAAWRNVDLVRPCKSMYQEIQQENSYWPSDEDIAPVFALLMNKNITNQLRVAQNYLTYTIMASCPTPNPAVMYCLKLDLIRQNLVSIVVRLQSQYSEAYNEAYSYTFFELLAEIGGVLDFWLGISLLTAFELVDLLWTIGMEFRKRHSLIGSDRADEVEKRKLRTAIRNLIDIERPDQLSAGCVMYHNR